jgi:hypothetical protein
MIIYGLAFFVFGTHGDDDKITRMRKPARRFRENGLNSSIRQASEHVPSKIADRASHCRLGEGIPRSQTRPDDLPRNSRKPSPRNGQDWLLRVSVLRDTESRSTVSDFS